MNKIALIAVDVQDDLCYNYPTGSVPAILDHLENLAEKAHVVIATQSVHSAHHLTFAEFGPHCVKGTRGARIVSAIKDLANYTPTRWSTDPDRESFSAFEASTLRPLETVEDILKLEKIDEVWVAGFGHGWDVPQTAFDANALGYPTIVQMASTRDLYPGVVTELEKAGIKINV